MIAAEKNRLQAIFGPAKQGAAAQSVRDTLSYLINHLGAAIPNVTSDNIPFAAIAGNEAAPGHTAPAVTFPFLAAPK